MSWISPRIWRSAESRFNDDEPLNCVDVYTPDVLQQISDQGFDAIWMRGRLWELIRSEIYPDLNDEKAGERIANLQKVIADGKAKGIKVYLYFNEPLALPRDHEFWKAHPELAGEPLVFPEMEWDVLAFCTSKPQFKPFFEESVSNLFDDAAGLGGVILITASEFHTHCWSHKALRKIGDEYIDRCVTPMACSDCKDREPADVVGELVNIWKTNADRCSDSPEVWAWNWSWSMWYDQPQREVIEKLPTGVKLMCDFERGGIRKQRFGDVFIDEYSLGFSGPGDRFVGSVSAARKQEISVCAKLQIGTTHELATVPNLPLIPNLFDKLKTADDLGVEGLMCSWNFGNSASLNTAALKLFAERADLRNDKDAFLKTLAATYFGEVDTSRILRAWQLFCDAFAQYPFSIKMLYSGPMNYSVAYPLKLTYEDRPMGPSWIFHQPWGDRLEDCLEPFSLDDVCRYLGLMDELWQKGMSVYEQAFEIEPHVVADELNCARMIGCHLSATRNIFEFHQWRRAQIERKGLCGSCDLEKDKQAEELMNRHVEILRKALAIVQKDSRFGYHQEPHEHFYDANAIEACIRQMTLAK